MAIAASELILNDDGSVYHLNLLPEDIAGTIILVGNPDRVPEVTKYFDTITLKKCKREFNIHTGTCNGKRISVVSTGIGTDNIDIVLNELDALANIDLKARRVKERTQSLNIIRIGTSGAIQEDIPVDSFLLSEFGIGLDGLLHFYNAEEQQYTALKTALDNHIDWQPHHIAPYVFEADESLARTLRSNDMRLGITVTNAGFYAPQGRALRLQPKLLDFHQKLREFQFQGRHITNLEMETAAIYGLSKLLGHRAVSMNAILANRANGDFSKNPKRTVDTLIQYCLEKLT